MRFISIKILVSCILLPPVLYLLTVLVLERQVEGYFLGRQIAEIYTGDPDWDAALALAQTAAHAALMAGGRKLPKPSFVRTRGPDDGFSPAGDGSDYDPSWSGQSPFDAYYVASLLPAAPEVRRGVLENFLSVQAHRLPWRRGSPSRSRWMPSGKSAAAAWRSRCS